MSKPLLISFIGVPGSGKTTFARLLAQKIGAITVNSDATRLAIWGSREAVSLHRSTPEGRREYNEMTFRVMNYVAASALKAGISCAFDANANRREDRQNHTAFAKELGAIHVVIRIKTPIEVAISRLTKREAADDQLAFDPEKARAVVNKFVRAIQEPAPHENVIEISGEIPFENQFATFSEALDAIQTPSDSRES